MRLSSKNSLFVFELYEVRGRKYETRELRTSYFLLLTSYLAFIKPLIYFYGNLAF
jgi:hypothetical protein